MRGGGGVIDTCINSKLSCDLSRALSGQEAAMGSEEGLVEIQPRELQFLFELMKQSSCSIRLVNKTDEYVAFKVKTTAPKRYCVRPNIGVILPRATCIFTVTMLAQKTAPPDLQIKDKFLVQTTALPSGITDEGLVPAFFSKETGRHIEENKMRVVLVSATQLKAEQPFTGVPNAKTAIKVSVAKDQLNIVNGEPNVVCGVPHPVKEPFSSLRETPAILSGTPFPVKETPTALQDIPVPLQEAPATSTESAIRLKETPAVSVESDFPSTETSITLQESPPPIKDTYGPKEVTILSEESPPHLEDTYAPKEVAILSDVLVNEDNNLHLSQVEDVKNLKSELTSLEVELEEAENLIIKMREEARSSIQERDKLRHEVMLLKRKRGQRFQDGFPLLFVVYMSLLGVSLGYLVHL